MSKGDSIKDYDVAIKVSDVSKSFRLPHERHNSLKGRLINFHRRGYEDQKALINVSFEVKKGEFFGIVGRNGSGKSTLLKILAGIYAPNKGLIKINGKLTPFIELGVGFNHELSGRDNVYLNGALLGFTRPEMDLMFDEIVAFAELERFMDQKLKNYSSGMQVRLAFSIAIRANTDILVLDEVLAVGDANFQKKCFDYFEQLKSDNKTVVLVSHDMSSVKRFSDRALLLERGEIVMIGDPVEVSDEYMRRNEIAAQAQAGSHQTQIGDEKVARITAVKFIDKKGNEDFEPRAISGINIKLDYICYRTPHKLNFGVGLWSASGAYVLGYNTKADNFKFDPLSGSIILNFDSLPLLSGSYHLNVICYGEDEAAPYDYHEKILRLEVTRSGAQAKYRGLIAVEHSWSSKM